MPLVRRTIIIETEAAFGKTPVVHTLYVPPSKVKPTDKKVADDDITERQLADLAARFPKEFGKLAKARNVEPLQPPEDDTTGEDEEPDLDDLDDADDEEDGEEEGPGAGDEGDEGEDDTTSAEYFVGLSASEAAQAVADQENATVLAAWLDTEKARKSTRATVVKAFKAKGLE